MCWTIVEIDIDEGKYWM